MKITLYNYYHKSLSIAEFNESVDHFDLAFVYKEFRLVRDLGSRSILSDFLVEI
jgi:hypothetical protein